MINLRAVALILFTLLASGCSWFEDDEDIDAYEPAELTEINEQFEANVIWSRDVGDGVGEFYNKLQPVVYDNKVIVADSEGLVRAFDAITGDEIWETEVQSEIYGGVAAGSNLVAIGTTNAEVIVLDAKTGEEKWRNLVSSEVIASPVITDGKVVARTIDGKVFAMNASTGERDWLYDRTVPALTLRGTSSLSASRGAVVTGFANGKIVLFIVENGKAVWEKRVASPSGRSELDRVVDVDATPLIIGDTVYAVTFNGNIAAFNMRSGDALWQREFSSVQNISVEGQLISVVGARSKVSALDRRTGGTLWSQEVLRDRKLTAAVSFGKFFVAGDYDGYLHWFDKTTGNLVARNSFGSGIVSDPVATGTHLYIYSRSGTLYALEAP